MRTLTIALLTTFVLAIGATRASAGTYDVVACNAPGANGVNNSWAPNANFAENLGPQPGLVNFDTSCPDGLVAVTSTTKQRANFLTGGSFNFVAPAGTTITALRATRFLHGEAIADNPGTPEPDGGRWDLYLQDATGLVGGLFGKEQCKPSPGFACTIGTTSLDTGVIPVATTILKWGFNCGGDTLQYCYTTTADGAPSQAQLILYGATVTLQDDSAPAADLDGELLVPGGWRRPTESLTWSGSDNTGIRSGQLLVDEVTKTNVDSACDATRAVPCPDVAPIPIALGAVADGHHELKLVVTDSAGNPTTVTKSVDLDGNAPTAILARASGKTITISVADGASGIAGGAIAVRNSTKEPFRTLPTTLTGGRLRATLDRGDASKVGIAIDVSDNAGNVTAGELSEMSLRLGGHALGVGTASVSYGASPWFSGRLATLRGGGRVRFSGRLGLRGATVPRSGKLVDLQAFDGGTWRTFATARARGSKGAWSSSYRFAGRPGRYPVRLRIRREDVFPYDLGYSRSVVVHVR